MFSETLLEHFQAPRNVGDMPDAHAQGEERNPVCGDWLQVWLRIEGGIVSDMTWRAEGCAPVIAAASVTSDLIRGMTVGQARNLDRSTIASALGGLPAGKMHAALLVVCAVDRALRAYGDASTKA